MRTALTLLLLAGLTGCAVYTPAGSVVIDPQERPSHGGGFCPPGQAKKGHC